MLIVYEKGENFFEKLKNIPTKNNARVFVTRLRNVDESGLISPTILIQVAIDNDILMFRYAEELPKFQVIAPASFSMAGSEVLKESALKTYNDSFIAFERKVEDEYQRVINAIRGMGFINIENALIQ